MRDVVGACDQVTARLRRGVRRVGQQRVTFAEGPFGDRPVDLVGADLYDARDPGAQACIEQHLYADRVGGDEVGCAVNAAVDVTFRGEVEDRVVAGQYVVEQRAVEDVALDEPVAPIVRDRREVLQVAGVRELVVDGHFGVLVADVAPGEQGPDVVRSDEPGGTRDQQLHGAQPMRDSLHATSEVGRP